MVTTTSEWRPGTRVRVRLNSRGNLVEGIVLAPDDPGIDPHLRATAQATGRSNGHNWSVPVRTDGDPDPAPMWFDPAEIKVVTP
jgi:hypothetical protein